MSNLPRSNAQDRGRLLVDFPSKLYSALRIIRLYPPTNPQVTHSHNAILESVKALLSDGKESVDIALAGRRLLIDGEELADKDQARPQIQGLATLFSTLKIHSFTFHQGFSLEDCSLFIQIIARQLDEKNPSESVSAQLEKSGIHSVSADLKRYVAISEEEEVRVKKDKDASTVEMTEDELADLLLGKEKETDAEIPLDLLPPKLIAEILAALPESLASHPRPEELEATVGEMLRGLADRAMVGNAEAGGIEQAADALAKLNPALAIRLLDGLPQNDLTDKMLRDMLARLTPDQRDLFAAELVKHHAGQENFDPTQPLAFPPDSLPAHILHLEEGKGTAYKEALERHADAWQMLHHPDTPSDLLPSPLFQRLEKPEWSAAVLATAAKECAASSGMEARRAGFSAFNQMLGRYEGMFGQETRNDIARQAGGIIASSVKGEPLASILSQQFKGLFGEELYQRILDQVSDELLDETVTHLTPKQLNRMVAALISDMPLQVGPSDQSPEYNHAHEALLQRLTRTSRSEEVQQNITLQQDTRQLENSEGKAPELLPPPLFERLQQPEWSAAIVANTIQKIADAPDQEEQQDAQTRLNCLLAVCEQTLSKDHLQQIARQTGEILSYMEGASLGNILGRKFQGLFGEEIYRQILEHVSDELLDDTVTHLTPKQLNRMIVALVSDLPLHLDQDNKSLTGVEEEPLAKRLLRTGKGREIGKDIAQAMDARRIREAGPDQLLHLPGQLMMRLQQPAWAGQVLAKAAFQATGQGTAGLHSFEKTLEQYGSLLDKKKQAQVAARAGAEIAATFEDRELGQVVVQKYKNIFGEQLYQQIINRLPEKKFGRLAKNLQALTESQEDLPEDLRDENVEAAYQRLMKSVRHAKMHKIVEMYRKQRQANPSAGPEREGIRELDRLANGDASVLTNKKNCHCLPERLTEMFAENQEDKADHLLMQLAIALQNNNPEIQANAAQLLAVAAGQLARLDQWQRLLRLVPALRESLFLRKEDRQSIRRIINVMVQLAEQSLLREDYAQAIATTNSLRSLSTEGAQKKDFGPQVRKLAVEGLNDLCTPSILDHLLDSYLHSESHQEAAAKLFIALSPQSTAFQLQQVMDSKNQSEHKQLLSLIRQPGNPALPLLLDQLASEKSWFAIRNGIRLLGEVEDPSYLPVIRNFIDHIDLRVQQEALHAAVRIDGEGLADFLLYALQRIDDSLKIKVVHQSASAYDERFVRPLTDLLENTKPFLGKNQNELQVAICKTLGDIGSKRAIASLTRVAQSKNVLSLAGYSDEVRAAAEEAIEQIRLAAGSRTTPGNARDAGEQPPPPAKAPKEAPSPAAKRGSPETGGPEERAIFALVAQGERDQAKKRLLDLITVTARAGQFHEAERLRERIYEIDNLALGEIIRAGEIIEQEKKGAIKEEDLEIWSNLTDHLTSEEFQTIYHEFTEHHYTPEETLVSQGEKNDALFFINEGVIKVSYMVGPKELFIASLNKGQIAGENFFSPSFWTITLTALTPSVVYILHQKALTDWQERFPGLRAKLYDFYITNNDIQSMLERKGLERRMHQRYDINRKIQVQPVNQAGQPIGRGFRAETADLSAGGLAFIIRISRQENARLLLGRKMQIVLPIGGPEKYLYLTGLVVGVQPFHILENDFSVHFRFDQPMDREKLRRITG